MTEFWGLYFFRFTGTMLFMFPLLLLLEIMFDSKFGWIFGFIFIAVLTYLDLVSDFEEYGMHERQNEVSSVVDKTVQSGMK